MACFTVSRRLDMKEKRVKGQERDTAMAKVFFFF